MYRVAEACGASWSTQQLKAELARDLSVVLIAEQRGVEVQGFAVGWQVADELQVLEVAVLPACRRRGVGTQLVRELIRTGCRTGGRALLEVRASNAPAIALYGERLGFTPVGRRRGYYTDGEDALLMALPLPVSQECGGV